MGNRDAPLHSCFINGRKYTVALASLSALQIRAMAGLSPDEDLVLEVKGAPDQLLGQGESVQLSSEPVYIFSRPPTSFG